MLGLWPARRGAQEQHQARVVARLRADPRRHGGDRRVDPHARDRVGGERSPGSLHRPDGRLPGVQAPLPGRPRGHAAVGPLLPRHQGQQVHDPGRRAVRPLRSAPDALPGVRQGGADRTPAVQSHVQDVHGPRRGGRRAHLPASRDRPGDVRELRQRPAVDATEAAVRDRAGRSIVPQRDHAGQLHLPDSGVRADGDRVLRQPERSYRRPAGRRVLARPVDRGLPRVVQALRPARRKSESPRARA